jgi:hypothetical protein
MRGAIAPHRLEFDEAAPVGPELDAVLGERGTAEVAAELLEAGAIVGRDPDVGVEVEAVELGLARATGGDVTEVRLVAEATDAGAGAGRASSPSSPRRTRSKASRASPCRYSSGSRRPTSSVRRFNAGSRRLSKRSVGPRTRGRRSTIVPPLKLSRRGLPKPLR